MEFVMCNCPDICAAIAEHRTNGKPYEMPSLLDEMEGVIRCFIEGWKEFKPEAAESASETRCRISEEGALCRLRVEILRDNFTMTKEDFELLRFLNERLTALTKDVNTTRRSALRFWKETYSHKEPMDMFRSSIKIENPVKSDVCSDTTDIASYIVGKYSFQMDDSWMIMEKETPEEEMDLPEEGKLFSTVTGNEFGDFKMCHVFDVLYDDILAPQDILAMLKSGNCSFVVSHRSLRHQGKHYATDSCDFRLE